MNTTKNSALNLRIPSDMKSKLEMVAKRDDRSVNSLINLILRDFLEKLAQASE